MIGQLSAGVIVRAASAHAAARSRKWASDGVARSACLARSSHWRSRTASCAPGWAMKAAAAAPSKTPPCRARLRFESAESLS